MHVGINSQHTWVTLVFYIILISFSSTKTWYIYIFFQFRWKNVLSLPLSSLPFYSPRSEPIHRWNEAQEIQIPQNPSSVHSNFLVGGEQGHLSEGPELLAAISLNQTSPHMQDANPLVFQRRDPKESSRFRDPWVVTRPQMVKSLCLALLHLPIAVLAFVSPPTQRWRIRQDEKKKKELGKTKWCFKVTQPMLPAGEELQ